MLSLRALCMFRCERSWQVPLYLLCLVYLVCEWLHWLKWLMPCLPGRVWHAFCRRTCSPLARLLACLPASHSVWWVRYLFSTKCFPFIVSPLSFFLLSFFSVRKMWNYLKVSLLFTIHIDLHKSTVAWECWAQREASEATSTPSCRLTKYCSNTTAIYHLYYTLNKLCLCLCNVSPIHWLSVSILNRYCIDRFQSQ